MEGALKALSSSAKLLGEFVSNATIILGPIAKIAALWNHGSVVRSWLLELAARALAEDADLRSLEAYVEDSGEGRWTLQEGLERGVPLPALAASLFTRFRSRESSPFAERMLAALRNQFGGHPVKKRDA